MLIIDPIVLGDDALDAVKTYLRITADDDDATLIALAIAATAACEAFTGRTLIARGATETVAPGCAWVRLNAWPVTAIGPVTVGGGGTSDGGTLATDTYALDIDADGSGRVRATGIDRQPLKVSYRTGLATRWSDIDEPLRHGMLVFVADRYAARDRTTDGALPPAVTALWRSGRRLRLR